MNRMSGHMSKWLILFAPLGCALHAFGSTGHQYQIVYLDSPLGWLEARDSAEALGGHLVVISSEEEQIEAASMFRDGDEAWIGGADVVWDRAWVWVTGEPFSYTNWSDDQPGNDVDEDYALMRQADLSRWTAVAGFASAFIMETGCCDQPSTGNVFGDDQDWVDIADVTRMIDHFFGSTLPFGCSDRANVNGDLDQFVTVADLERLINHLYSSFVPTAPCWQTRTPVTETFVIIDDTGVSWDISQAVHYYALEAEEFLLGLGPNAIAPILDPVFIEPDHPDYPGDLDPLDVLGVSFIDESRTYPLRTLIGHEVVNDRHNDTYFVAAY